MTWRRLHLLFSLLIFLGVLLVLWHDRPFGFLGQDTEQYHAVADLIRSGNLFSRYQGPEPHLGVIIRTPGYPLLLLAAELISPNNLEFGIKVLHSAIAVLTGAVLVLTLGESIPIGVISFALSIIFIKNRQLFSADMSEWLSINQLLICFGLLFYCLRARTRWATLVMGFSFGILPLLHPSLVVALAAPLIVAVVYRCQILPIASLTLFPIALWMGLNLFRFGLFTLTPYTSLALFAVGGTLGGAQLAPEDPPALRELTEYANARIVVAEPQEYVDLERLDSPASDHRFLEKYNQNMLLAKGLLQQEGSSLPVQNELLRQYGLRALREHFSKYLSFLFHNLQSLGSSALMFLPGILLPLYLIRKKSQIELRYASGVFYLIHLTHVLTVGLISPIIPRYFLVAFYPALFSCIILVYVFLTRVAHK